MRNSWIAAAVALGATLLLSLGMVNWRIDPDRVRGDLAAALGPVEAPAAASLRLLPRPTLKLSGFRFRAAGGALDASAAEAQVTLRFDRLLVGAFAPLGLTLRDVALHIDLDAAEPVVAGLAGPPVSRLSVARAKVEIVSARRGFKTRLDLGDARVEWGSADGALRASATGRWRGQPVAASIDLDAPLVAAHGGVSALRAAFAATALAQLDLTGDWSPQGRADGAVYRGQTTALIPSLERFFRWMGWTPAPGPQPAGLELSARVTADTNLAKFSDAELKLGDQPFEGDIDVMRSPVGVAVSGTLAADALDLAALIGTPPPLFDASGDWSKAPALPKPIPGLDLDLRVSATRADWGGHEIDNAAAAVSQRDGRFGVKLLDSGFAHGSLTGEFWIDDKQDACESRLALSLENADLGALATEFGARDFAGEGALKVAVHARGRSPADLIASADGEGSLEISDGVLRELNFEEALRRAQRRLIDVARDMNAGATRFGSARGRLEVSDGEARFVDAATKAPGLSLSLSGAIDLKARAFRARVTARQSEDDGTPTPDGAHIDFALYGPWAGPVLAPLVPPAD
jgi:AsmA protein